MNARNKIKNTRNFNLDLNEVNEQSDDEMSIRSFERKAKTCDKRNSIGAMSLEIDNKTKTLKLNSIGSVERKVKFSSKFEDSDSNEDHKEIQSGNEASDSQYESQDSCGSLKLRQRKISAPNQHYNSSATRKISDSKSPSSHTPEDIENIRKISSVPSMALNRRDSRVQIFEDPESGVKSLKISEIKIKNLFLEKNVYASYFTDRGREG